jgi:hypothetical protein
MQLVCERSGHVSHKIARYLREAEVADLACRMMSTECWQCSSTIVAEVSC